MIIMNPVIVKAVVIFAGSVASEVVRKSLE